MNENQSQTESLLDIVRSVKEDTILLPEFQRDFRWEMWQTYDLFDSLVREIFIGTVIYGKPSFEMTLRNIDDRPRRGKGSRAALVSRHYSAYELETKSKTKNLRIILDGQQRITSVYRALTGADNVWFVCKKDLCPEQLFSGTLEDILDSFSGEESPDAVSIRLSDAYRAENEGLEDSDMDACFADTAFHTRVLEGAPNLKEWERAYRRTAKKLIDLYKKQKLVAFHLLDITLEKFCTFFERSNSRGVQLNFTDILAAKLYHGFNLRLKIEQFESEHPITLNREAVIRAIALFSAIEKNKPIVIDKQAILTQLEPGDFQKHWDTTVKLYVNTIDYLTAQKYVVSSAWLPSVNMIIPLMAFLRRIKGFDRMTENQRTFLEYWFWASVFSNRYSYASNEVIILDSQALAAIANGERIEKRDFFIRLRSQIQGPDDLFTYTKRTSATYRGVLNLIGFAAKGLLDWKSSQAIETNKDIDDHHIFPRAYLDSGVSVGATPSEIEQLKDCVVNRTLIPRNLNITIGKKSPYKYFSEIRAGNAKLDRSLQGHLIPATLIDDPSGSTAFSAFLDERSKLIFELIERYVIERSTEMENMHGLQSDGVGMTTDSARSAKLTRGLRTPESAFCLPILRILNDSGGSLQMSMVLDKLEAALGSSLKTVDREPLTSDPSRPRWKNTAQWARANMIQDGLLKGDSPRGIWEITTKGKKHLAKQADAN